MGKDALNKNVTDLSRRGFIRKATWIGATACLGSAFGKATTVEKAMALTASCLSVPSIGANTIDQFVLLKGGNVTIGSPKSERQRDADEESHTVNLSPFYIDPYEVTQKDYEAVTGKNPSYFKGENLPVENVTWFDAINYCNALSRSKGLTPVYTIEGETITWNRAANGYRLLTEAEWEYAARAGSKTIFHVGDQITSKQVNFQGHYPYLIEENYVRHKDPKVITSDYRAKTIAVGSLPPNQFGLYDMYGNVSEWCFDYYGKYDLTLTENPAGALSGSLRVNRGGAYNDFGKHVRSAYRSATSPYAPDRNLGFRLARNAEPGKGTIVTTYALDIKMPRNPRILVAYFSYSGNTEKGAKIIANKTGGDLFEIEMQTPYRGNIYEVSQKDLNQNVHPALKSLVKNIGQYDVILLGYPTWWATMPMPIVSFLEKHNLAGKMIVTFSSHGGTGFGDSVSDVSKLLPKSKIGQALQYHYSGGRTLESDISNWLKLNGITEKA